MRIGMIFAIARVVPTNIHRLLTNNSLGDQTKKGLDEHLQVQAYKNNPKNNLTFEISTEKHRIRARNAAKLRQAMTRVRAKKQLKMEIRPPRIVGRNKMLDNQKTGTYRKVDFILYYVILSIEEIKKTLKETKMQKQILKVQALDTQAKFKKVDGRWEGKMPLLITYTDGSYGFLDVVSYCDKTRLQCAMWLMRKALKIQRVATLEIHDQVA